MTFTDATPESIMIDGDMLTWDNLYDAASQPDEQLASAYRHIRTLISEQPTSAAVHQAIHAQGRMFTLRVEGLWNYADGSVGTAKPKRVKVHAITPREAISKAIKPNSDGLRRLGFLATSATVTYDPGPKARTVVSIPAAPSVDPQWWRKTSMEVSR